MLWNGRKRIITKLKARWKSRWMGELTKLLRVKRTVGQTNGQTDARFQRGHAIQIYWVMPLGLFYCERLLPLSCHRNVFLGEPVLQSNKTHYASNSTSERRRRRDIQIGVPYPREDSYFLNTAKGQNQAEEGWKTNFKHHSTSISKIQLLEMYTYQRLVLPFNYSISSFSWLGVDTSHQTIGY